MSADLGSPMGDLDFDFRMTFTFPGTIIEASGGEVDGNSVTFTDVNEVTQGVDIRADASSFPWVIVVVAVLIIGFLFLVVLAAVVFFVLRARRNKSTPAAVPGAYSAASAQGAPQGQPGQPASSGAVRPPRHPRRGRFSGGASRSRAPHRVERPAVEPARAASVGPPRQGDQNGRAASSRQSPASDLRRWASRAM